MTNIVAFSPQMTSNTAPSPFVASASSVFQSGYAAYKAFTDLVLADYTYMGWLSSGGGTCWIQMDLGTTSALPILSQYGIGNYAAQGGYSPKSWTFAGSNDGSTFTTLDTQSSVANWTTNPETRIYSISPSQQYRYYRLTITANQAGSGASYVSLGQLKFYFPQPSAGGGVFPSEMNGGFE